MTPGSSRPGVTSCGYYDALWYVPLLSTEYSANNPRMKRKVLRLPNSGLPPLAFLHRMPIILSAHHTVLPSTCILLYVSTLKRQSSKSVQSHSNDSRVYRTLSSFSCVRHKYSPTNLHLPIRMSSSPCSTHTPFGMISARLSPRSALKRVL
jgi:hypothetical protein